jgi:hypothetical protein
MCCLDAHKNIRRGPACRDAITLLIRLAQALCKGIIGQKVHRFQGQFRVSRSSSLPASLGGLMGPCSNPWYNVSVPLGPNSWRIDDQWQKLFGYLKPCPG